MRYNSREEVERIGRAGSCLWLDAPQGLAARYLSAFWLYLERDDQAFTPHAPDGFWEAWITYWMSKEMDKADVFIDVGANVGYYTLMAAKAGLFVDAFEPNPPIADMIFKSVLLNRARTVVIREEAIADKPGTMRLSVPEGHSGGAHLSDEGDFDIKVDTFDNIYPMPVSGKVLVKIDAEGAEPLIWAGMQKFFQRNDVTVILEWEPTRFNVEEFAKALLGDYNNSCYYVDTQGNEVPLVHWKQFEMLPGIQMVVVRKRND